MTSSNLREQQAPLKARYRAEPGAAVVTMHAAATLAEEDVTCVVDTACGPVTAGLHPAAGGDGDAACSGDMLLQALAACTGVTLRAVATSLGMDVRGTVRVDGDLDFRGTLGVATDAPVGFRDIRVRFELDTDASADEVARLVRLTERYCVVLQTIAAGSAVSVSVEAGASETPG